MYFQADSLSCFGISPLNPQQVAWYQKADVTFSDVYVEVHKALWRSKLINGFAKNGDPEEIIDPILIASLLDQLADTG